MSSALLHSHEETGKATAPDEIDLALKSEGFGDVAWIKSRYSKTRVRRAGRMLVSKDPDPNELLRAHGVLSNWRASHAYPMHAMLINLRDKSAELDKNSIVVQRLKRSPSIVAKLRRYPTMKLSTMQDIGGCRSVVATAKRVERLTESLTTSRTSHILEKVNNYVACPKESGYRGVHLIYRYNASKTDYRGHLVELQLRSRVQHAWATAVEIVDNFTDQALKASIGDEDWLQFFKMAGAELAKLEKRPIGEHVDGVDTRAELVRLETKLNAFERLNMIRFATKFSERKRVTRSDYFLIDVDYRERKIFTERYAPGQLAQATRDYSRRERQILDDRDHDVVLVSGESVASIQAGYPNYFVDAKNFIGYVFKATSRD